MNDQDPPARKKQSPSGWLLQIAIVVIIVVTLVIILDPTIRGQKKKADMMTAISHAKCSFYLFVEFDQDFGEFPSDRTAQEIEGIHQFTGNYANDYLGQFIAANYTQSEEIFFTYGNKSWSKPDNLVDTPEQILAEGECGFAYIKGLNTKNDGSIPLLLAPMYGDGYKFNPYPFNNKVVVLRIDGSIKQYRLNKARKAVIEEGKTLFQGGAESVWGEKGFDSSNLLYPSKPYTP